MATKSQGIFKGLKSAQTFAGGFLLDFPEVLSIEFEDVLGDDQFTLNVEVSTKDYNKDILKYVNALSVKGS